MDGKTGNQKIIEQFLADGMNTMFGNPGTVEQGFLDALAGYPEMKYFLTLQESIAVLVADGIAACAWAAGTQLLSSAAAPKATHWVKTRRCKEMFFMWKPPGQIQVPHRCCSTVCLSAQAHR